MANIHPFDRAKEFPNYFEIMLNSVPEGKRDVFVKKIQKLIEENISAIVKRLKLYYVNDQGELSTADYFNELVKRMEHALEESPAKDDYHLEVYLSGGVVRTLLGYVYRQLHINIQEVFEGEFAAAKKSTDKDEVFTTVLGELKNSIEPDQAKQKALEVFSTREAFLKTFTKTPEFWLQKLKTEQSKLQNSYVLGVGSDMDILYKLSPRTARNESKLNNAQLEKLHKVLWQEKALNNKQKKALYNTVKEQTLNEAQLKDLRKALQNQYQLYDEELEGLQQAIEATKKLDEKQFDEAQSLALSNTEKTVRAQHTLQKKELQDLEQAIDNLHKLPERALKESQELYETIQELIEIDTKRLKNLEQAIENGHRLELDKKQGKTLDQAIKSLGELTSKELKELQKTIYDKSPLTPEQLQTLALAIKNQRKLNDEQWENLKQAIQSGSELNTEQLQKLHRAINMQRKLKLKSIKKNVQDVGNTFINSAANFFNLSDVDETLKNSLLPPGDVNEYTKQTTSSMSQGGSALDWLAFEISPKTGRKLIEPPSDLRQQAKMTASIVENFIRGNFEYLEPQITETTARRTETTARRTASVVRGLRPLFEIPFLKIKDEQVILDEMKKMQAIGELERDGQGNIILPPRTSKQLEKLRRNTPFQGAHNRATRPDPESTVLSTFLGISKEFAPSADGRMNVHFPKYVQSVTPLDKTPTTGEYQSEIDTVLVDTKTFIADFTDAGTLYHGTPLNAVTAIVRGGFYTSDSTQGAGAYGSGLYSTKDRAVALGYSESVLPLHIDTEKAIKVINLDNMNSQAPTLLHRLQAEATQGGFLDVNELLKIRYNVDVIISTYVLIQNTAVIKPIKLNDLSTSYGAQFEKKFMSAVQLGDKSFRLISENIDLRGANKFFEHYTNLCLLSGAVETDLLSPVKIIKNLTAHVEQLEKTQPDFSAYNTQLFIYMQCFLAKPSYVITHLTDISKHSNNNPEIMNALVKFTQSFATSFKQSKKEDHETLVAILKNLILYSNTDDLIIGTLNALERIEPQELIGAVKSLISSAEITQTQMLYFLAKIDDEELRKTYLTLFDLERPENKKRLKELSEIRALTINEIYKQHPKEIFENINMQDALGNTYLFHLCATGADEEIRKILKLPVDLSLFDQNGKTALWMAIENKNITDQCIIEMIQHSNVDLNYIYNHETAVLSALTAKRDTLVAYLLSNSTINLNIKKQGLNILHLASQNGLQKTIHSLLTQHSTLFNLNQLDNNLNTPLMLAIKSDQHAVIKMLFELQTITNVLIDLDVKNNDGFSALDIAAQNGDKELIKYLFAEQKKRRSEYSADALGSALMHAILNNRELEVIKMLFELQATTNTLLDLEFKNNHGLSALDVAAQNGDKELIKYLFAEQKKKRSEYSTDALGSALMHAILNNRELEVIKMLFELQATTNILMALEFKNNHGLSVLDIAAQNGDKELIEYLFAEQRKEGSEYSADALGSALTYAILNKREGVTEILLNTLPAPNLNYMHINGLTPLASAVEGKQLTVALKMVQKAEQPIDSGIQNNVLESVYILKCQNNDNDDISSTLFTLMLEKKYKDADGKILKLASAKGDIDNVKNMIEQIQYLRKDFLNAILSATTSPIFSKSETMKNNTVLYLLDHLNKTDPNNINWRWEEQRLLNSILINTVKNNSIDVVNKLLDNYKFDTRALEKALNEALEKSSNWHDKTTDADTTKLLRSILKQYEPKNIADSSNIYPTLMYACEKGIPDIVTDLLEKNVDPNQMFRNTTLFLTALRYGHRDIALRLIQAGTINFDMRPEHDWGEGDNALERAVRNSDIEMVKQILAKVQELNIEMYNDLKQFEAAVQLACASGNLELIDLIIDSNLYKNKKDPLRLGRVISSFYDSFKHNPEMRTTVVMHLLKREFTCPPSLYNIAVKGLESDILLRIFETRKEYIPNDPEKGFEFLEKINIKFFNQEQKTKAQNIIFALLTKGYLNLDIVENYLNKNNDGSWKCREYNLIINIFNNIKLEDLKNYPDLISNLVRRESFDKHLDSEICMHLSEKRKVSEKFIQLCSEGNDSDTRDMLRSNTDLNLNKFDEKGNTALGMMIKNPNITDEHIIEIIKEHKIDLENISKNEHGYKSAILLACTTKRDTLVAYLLSHPAINQYQRKDFLNAISSAFNRTNPIFPEPRVMANNMALYLLDHLNTTDPSNISFEEQRLLNSILINAVENNSIDVVNKLLDNYKFDTRALEEALNEALEKNSNWHDKTTDADTTKLLRSILKQYEPKNIADSSNIYPTLMYACEKGIPDIVTDLLKKNVDPNQMFRNTTLFLTALRYGHRDIALRLIQAGTINFDMRPEHDWGEGDNALERAVRNSDIEMVKQILAKVQELNIEMYNDLKQFEAAVQLACASGNLELIDLIIDSNLYKNKKDPLRLGRVISSFYDSFKHNPEMRTTVVMHLLKREFTCPPSLYNTAVKGLESDILLRIFETRKEYIPNDPEKGFEFLEKINIKFFNQEQKTKAQNIIFALLTKGYLNLDIVEDYLNKNNDGLWQCREYNLIINIFNNIKLEDLKNYPDLISNLVRRESFEKHLGYKACEQLAKIRKPYEKLMAKRTVDLPAEDDTSNPEFTMHLIQYNPASKKSKDSEQRRKDSKDDSSSTQKPEQ